MDSHWYGSIEVFQTGCPHDNFGQFLYMQISAAIAQKFIFFINLIK